MIVRKNRVIRDIDRYCLDAGLRKFQGHSAMLTQRYLALNYPFAMTGMRYIIGDDLEVRSDDPCNARHGELTGRRHLPPSIPAKAQFTL